MPTNPIENKNTAAVLISIGKTFIIISFLIPTLSLLFRLLNYELLKLFSFDQDVMNPASAICFILLSISIWLIRDEEPNTRNKFLSNAICIFMVLIGAIRLITIALDLPFYLDEILFREQIMTEENVKGNISINLMSPTTGILLIIMGTSILITNYGTHHLYKIAQFLNYFTVLTALLSIYGYVYQIKHLISYHKFAPIPIYNTLTIFFLASGILFLRPHKGSMKTLVSENTIQIILLRFLALIVPLLIGIATIKGENKGWFGEEFGTALYASTTFAISMVLLGWKSQVQSKLRKVRIRNEEKIEKDKKRLNQILDLAPPTISIIDLKSEKFLFSNRSNRKNFGINNQILKGQKYTDVMKILTYKEDLKKVLERFSEFKQLKKDEDNELAFRVYDKSGEIVWLLSKASGYKYKKDKVKEVILNSLDITNYKKLQEAQEKKTEEIEDRNKELYKINNELEELGSNLEDKIKNRVQEIKESEQSCKTFFENSSEGIMRIALKDIDGIDINLAIEEQEKLIRKHGYIAELNNTMVQMHGYEYPKEIIGELVTDFMNMPTEDKAKVFTEFVKSGYMLDNFQTNPLDKNGNRLHYRNNFIGIVEDGKFKGAWGTQKLLKEI